MYAVISKFVVANDMSESVRQAFRDRPHQVDNEPGFIGMDVIQPKGNEDEFWLITRWDSEADWKNWYHSHSYKDSHQGIPAGLKLISEATEITHFDVIAT